MAPGRGGAGVTIARIGRTRGVRGEVTATLLTDFPERFEGLSEVTLRKGELTFTERLERHWFHKGRIILKFEGRDRPHEVDELVGCELQVAADERHPLPDRTYFDDDLRGCEVVEEGRRLGFVSDVYRGPGGVRNLVVRREGGGEFMIPLVESIVQDVDLGESVVSVRLPQRLVEATLTPAPERRRKTEDSK